MCLILTRPKTATKTTNDEWLENFFSSNHDGYGFMFAFEDRLHVHKELGDVAKFKEAWRYHEGLGVDFACHLRMRTHGKIDLENCHPYQILGPESGCEMWLMHNGILSVGNAADDTKSDTWHFIKTYLRPLLDPAVGGDPNLAFKPQFSAILASAIGTSNKFVIMDQKGRTATLNKSSGVEWNEMWLSNMYAWSYSARNNEKPYKYANSYGTDYEGYEYTGRERYNRDDWRRNKEGSAGGKKSTADLKIVGGKKDSQSSPSPSSDTSNANEEDRYSNLEDTEVFGDMKSLGLDDAWRSVSYASMKGFRGHFGTKAVYDLMDVVLGGIITETVFSGLFLNYKRAKEVLAEHYAARAADAAEFAEATVEVPVAADSETETAPPPKLLPVVAAPPPVLVTHIEGPLSEEEADAELDRCRKVGEAAYEQLLLSENPEEVDGEAAATDAILAESEAVAMTAGQPHAEAA